VGEERRKEKDLPKKGSLEEKGEMNDDDDKDVPDSSRAPCQNCCDATKPNG